MTDHIDDRDESLTMPHPAKRGNHHTCPTCGEYSVPDQLPYDECSQCHYDY